MFSATVIAIIIFFGGFFAFLGDRVGMKVGKKRLSIFGLRPRYTSIIITILTGFLIAGLTLMALMMVSEYLRLAIFRLQQVQEDLHQAVTRVQVLTKQVSQKELEYQRLSHKNDQLQKQLKEVVDQRQKAQLQLQQTEKQYHDATTALTAAQASLKNTKEDLELAQGRLKNLSKLNEDLKNQIASLTLQESRLSQQIQELEGSLKNLANIAAKPVIFNVEEILATRIVEFGTPADEVFKREVEPLLKSANEIALKRGARIPGKTDYALRVPPQRVADVCSQLAKLEVPAVLRVVVEKNSVLGEPVTVTLKFYPNQLIFKKGAVVAETVVSSATPAANLRDQLLSLVLRANSKAIEQGIYTGGQNLRNLISVSEIATTINLIRSDLNTQYQVSLVTTSDIFRVDSLKLKFELRSI